MRPVQSVQYTYVLETWRWASKLCTPAVHGWRIAGTHCTLQQRAPRRELGWEEGERRADPSWRLGTSSRSRERRGTSMRRCSEVMACTRQSPCALRAARPTVAAAIAVGIDRDPLASTASVRAPLLQLGTPRGTSQQGEMNGEGRRRRRRRSRRRRRRR